MVLLMIQAFSLTDWVSWDLLEGWSDGSTYDTPDLTTILQGIVERSGWSSGNSVILIIEDVSSVGNQRGFSSIQYGSGEERAILFVTYTAREGQAGSSIGIVIQQEIINSNMKRFLARTSNGDLHSVYRREINGVQQLCYAKSVNNGIIWTETVLTVGEHTQNNPSIAIDSNDYIHIVWSGATIDYPWPYPQIRYIKYTTNWSSPILLTNDSDSSSTNPYIAIDSNDYIHVVWRGFVGSPSYAQIKYIKYTTSWGTETNLTNTPGKDYQQYFPCIAIDSNDHLHVVWTGGIGNDYSQIRYIKYTTSWSAITNLTSDNYNQYSGAFIAIDSNDHLHIAWTGRHSASPDYSQIRYIKYTTSWSAITNLTSGNFDSGSNTIAVDKNDYIHIVGSGRSVSSPDYLQLLYIKYTTSWSFVERLTIGDYNQGSASLIWALHPTIGGLKTNVPNTGFAFVWGERIDAIAWPYYTTNFKYYASNDLTWET